MNRFRQDPVYRRGDLVMFHDPARAGKRQGVKNSRKFVNPWLGPCKVVDFFPQTLTVKLQLPETASGRSGGTHRIHAERVKPYISRDTGKWCRGPGLEEEEGLPTEEAEEALKNLSQEHREVQAELDYDEDAFIDEGLEFIDQAPYTNEGDMINWRGPEDTPYPESRSQTPEWILKTNPVTECRVA